MIVRRFITAGSFHPARNAPLFAAHNRLFAVVGRGALKRLPICECSVSLVSVGRSRFRGAQVGAEWKPWLWLRFRSPRCPFPVVARPSSLAVLLVLAGCCLMLSPVWRRIGDERSRRSKRVDWRASFLERRGE